jgi:hypothetical protein
LKNNIIIESLKQEKRIILNISNTALQWSAHLKT